MPQAKAISRKHLSIINIFSMLSSKQSQTCLYCGNIHYTYYDTRELYECTRCHKQTTLKTRIVMQVSNLCLFRWIFMFYFICDSTNGVSALELSRRVGIGYTSARLNSYKIKYVMLRNDNYHFNDSVIEHDEILIDAPTRRGKRRMGLDKQKAFMNVGLENNIYPTCIESTLINDCRNKTIKKNLQKITDGGTAVTIKTDGKVGLGKPLQLQIKSYSIVNDHKYLYLINTITSNLKAFILGNYHGIAKCYLCFTITEFERRFNRKKI